jgi:hypothetical protein
MKPMVERRSEGTGRTGAIPCETICMSVLPGGW